MKYKQLTKKNKNMNFKEYQDLTQQTAVYPKEHALSYALLGLAGEVGEVTNKYKKVLRGDKPFDDTFRENISHEIGDVLWYVARLAEELNLNLDEIAKNNIEKLIRRKENNTIKGDGDNR